ncbi:Protein of unknown function [Pseudidiomarina planktonica]|uniref:Uncharacterized protein n=1 Tax=Pseudidiomarina planktonica TaxID=1323738 RepID=A0A1Y6FWT8_9GAMM|nr:DUF3185 family protein [Pseudidiomarina planktonica]RUO63878.1 DUF3185 domain-containing protein [Pseudidiomarina planktonica]SMQ80048.1 Protein of unknown function [Pseudidiomarina planktonica]
MNKIIGIALLVAGVILLYFGWEAYNSAASQATEMMTGQPTDNSMWFLIAGAVAVIIGLFGLIRGK